MQSLLSGGGFGRRARQDVDSAGLGGREGTGDVLEGAALGLWHEEENEDDEQNEQHDEHDERVLAQLFLHDSITEL